MAEALIYPLPSPFAGDLSDAGPTSQDGEPADDGLEELTLEDAIWTSSPRPTRPVAPGRWRWAFTFGVVALLVAAFGAIALWGLTHSDWLYGTYGQITDLQWDQINQLRAELVQLDIAPDAVSALDDALLLPRPSTEDVLYQVEKAVLALDRFSSHTAARRIQKQLGGLAVHIKAGHQSGSKYDAQPTPTLNPILLPH